METKKTSEGCAVGLTCGIWSSRYFRTDLGIVFVVIQQKGIAVILHKRTY